MTDNDSSRGKRRGYLIGFAATLGVAAAIVTPVVVDSSAVPAAKVTVCHRTDSETNPYVKIVVSANAAYHGHYLKHQGDGVWSPTHPKKPKWGDIIAPFTYRGQSYQLNYSDNAAGKTIFDNGCSVTAPVPSSSVPGSGPATGTA
ncbi:MAG TPA: hypothetical protein VFH38_07905 [Jatrophihabitans sp.]|nr:hypothetical protein [Jatrophihabitans sp.]